MALAMVEEEHGHALADGLAARLVLYLRRPGFQSQFSEALVAQRADSAPLDAAIAWARANLGKANIDTLAKRAGLSTRTFHRRCLELLSTTPARLVDKLRVEHARTLLATSHERAPRQSSCHAVRLLQRHAHEARVRARARDGPRAYRLVHGSA